MFSRPRQRPNAIQISLEFVRVSWLNRWKSCWSKFVEEQPVCPFSKCFSLKKDGSRFQKKWVLLCMVTLFLIFPLFEDTEIDPLKFHVFDVVENTVNSQWRHLNLNVHQWLLSVDGLFHVDSRYRQIWARSRTGVSNQLRWLHQERLCNCNIV